MKFILQLVVFFLFSLQILAQAKYDFQEQYHLNVKRTDENIVVDGLRGEIIWDKAGMVSDFWEKYPNDKEKAKRRTEIRVLTNDQYLYFFITAYDTSSYVIRTLKRDNGIYQSDAVSIAIDPVDEKTNGFLFSVNPYNVQSEDLISNNSDGLNWSWDNTWLSETKRYEDHWTAEIAIPFKTLRYSKDKKTWGINFLRSDLKNNQYSSWTHMPANFNFYDFGYYGSLDWEKPPPPPGRNITFIPYVAGSAISNKEENITIKGKLNAGFDGKVAVTPALNLDITVNPDFSQIEVDEQVTNLTRFNIFFPERRTFFLENDDIFSAYAIPPIRPFYSRRIGLDQDGNTIPIAGGIRLSGNIGKKTRIGIMNMQTLKTDNYEAQNYTAVSFNERVQKRSLVKGYFLNRQAIGNENGFADPLDAFGRNAGLEYNFSDKGGKWSGWTGFHKSIKSGISSADNYLNIGGSYSTKKFNLVTDYSDVGENFYTDMGFVQRIDNYDAKTDSTYRVGFRHLFTSLRWKIFPEQKKITQHSFGLENYIVFNRNGTLNERNTSIQYELNFRNTSSLNIELANNQTNLLFYTQFTDDTYQPLPPGSYNYSNFSVQYESDGRKKFIYSGSVSGGQFYNGQIRSTMATFTYRIQPWVNFTLVMQNSHLKFPYPYGFTDLILIAPRVEINFSNNVFWTTFLQFNNQNNNFNINSRFQWRFKPMSDLFVVYTDNYYTDPLLKNKNRALVFKLNYWFNL
jgi:Domain of unknown function (DUF5916)/Carbohydrate family 9 binding domain-like